METPIVELTVDSFIRHPDASVEDLQTFAAAYHRGEITYEKFKQKTSVYAAKGTRITHPQAHLLVGMGIATPVNESAKNLSARYRVDAAQLAAQKLARGQQTGDPRMDLRNGERHAQAFEIRKARRAGELLLPSAQPAARPPAENAAKKATKKKAAKKKPTGL